MKGEKVDKSIEIISQSALNTTRALGISFLGIHSLRDEWLRQVSLVDPLFRDFIENPEKDSFIKREFDQAAFFLTESITKNLDGYLEEALEVILLEAKAEETEVVDKKKFYTREADEALIELLKIKGDLGILQYWHLIAGNKHDTSRINFNWVYTKHAISYPTYQTKLYSSDLDFYRQEDTIKDFIESDCMGILYDKFDSIINRYNPAHKSKARLRTYLTKIMVWQIPKRLASGANLDSPTAVKSRMKKTPEQSGEFSTDPRGQSWFSETVTDEDRTYPDIGETATPKFMTEGFTFFDILESAFPWIPEDRKEEVLAEFKKEGIINQKKFAEIIGVDRKEIQRLKTKKKVNEKLGHLMDKNRKGKYTGRLKYVQGSVIGAVGHALKSAEKKKSKMNMEEYEGEGTYGSDALERMDRFTSRESLKHFRELFNIKIVNN